jgi:hypothetical protein
MYKKAKFLISCMIFVAGGAFCQDPFEKTYSVTDIFDTKFRVQPVKGISNLSFFQKGLPKKPGQTKFNQQAHIKAHPVSCFAVSADFYTQNFGFICKKELQLEKVTKIPFRFRLGSLQYTDYLEGKPNAGILPAY